MRRLFLLVFYRAPWLVPALLLLLMVWRVPAFRHGDYWVELSHQHFTITALALVLTPVILTGGIDLSVGAVSVLTSVVIGALWRDAGLPIAGAVAGGLAAAVLAGALNGGLVLAGVYPLVATLATAELFRGFAAALSADRPVSRFPPALETLWRTDRAGLPLPVYGIAVVFMLMYLLVHQTWLGRILFALGDNERAARFAGLPVRRTKLGLYLCSALVAGVCGLTSVMEYGTAKAEADKSLELVAITCVVLGGVRITGGAGNVAGTLLGTLTLAALWNGLQDLAADWRETLIGVLLLAVAVTNETAARLAGNTIEKVPAQPGPNRRPRS